MSSWDPFENDVTFFYGTIFTGPSGYITVAMCAFFRRATFSASATGSSVSARAALRYATVSCASSLFNRPIGRQLMAF
jgi:hypothetical protein